MATKEALARLALVDVPASLMRPDLKRELPRGIRFVDYTGTKYPQCEVLGLVGFLRTTTAFLYRCQCGELFLARGAITHYRGGQTCGCAVDAAHTTHGMSNTPEHHAWNSMRQRCNNPNVRGYRRYGGRGVRVCHRWSDSFEAFYADMGPRPSDEHSIDRIENDGLYSCGKCVECRRNGWPKNCRWATKREQLLNKTIPMREYTLNGVTHSLSDWAAQIGVSRERMRQRVDKCLALGIDISEALTTPAGETMPSLQNQYERYRLRIAQRNAQMVKDQWFDGQVHVIRQGKDWSGKIACETFREIIRAESQARGGECKFRILRGHIMFAYENKTAAQSVA